MTTTNNDLQINLKKLDAFFETYLVKKAPQIPTNIKELIVKYSPYLNLFVLVISLPPLLAALGIGAFFAPFAYLSGFRYGASFSFAALFLAASLVLMVMSIKGLFHRQLSAWKLVYYSVLLSAVHSFLNFNLPNMIFSSAISLYILYQVKSYYK